MKSMRADVNVCLIPIDELSVMPNCSRLRSCRHEAKDRRLWGYKSILRTWSRVFLGEIALFGSDLESSLLGIFDDHVSSAPSSVPSRIAGDIGQAILVAQFISNGVKNFIELANFVGKKASPPVL